MTATHSGISSIGGHDHHDQNCYLAEAIMVKASCTIEGLPMPSDLDLHNLLISYFKIQLFIIQIVEKMCRRNFFRLNCAINMA
jgi:hypothetical protein